MRNDALLSFGIEVNVGVIDNVAATLLLLREMNVNILVNELLTKHGSGSP